MIPKYYNTIPWYSKHIMVYITIIIILSITKYCIAEKFEVELKLTAWWLVLVLPICQMY